jgi:hypothetical protein
MPTHHIALPNDDGHLEIVAFVLPPEGPQDHARNAAAILAGLEANHPGLWAMNPDLSRAARRTASAIVLLELPGRSGYAPASVHLRRAVAALCESPIEWDIVTDVRAICALLIHAIFMVEGGA